MSSVESTRTLIPGTFSSKPHNGVALPTNFNVCTNLVHHNAATHNAAMHNASFSQRYPNPFFLQRHRCDALPCFSASPVEIFYIAHIALRPLLPFFLSPQWFTVQNNKKFAKSYNAAMSPLATRDGQRNAQRTTQRCGALSAPTPAHLCGRATCVHIAVESWHTALLLKINHVCLANPQKLHAAEEACNNKVHPTILAPACSFGSFRATLRKRKSQKQGEGVWKPTALCPWAALWIEDRSLRQGRASCPVATSSLGTEWGTRWPRHKAMRVLHVLDFALPIVKHALLCDSIRLHSL